MSSAEQILKRFDDMKSERRYYEPLWEEIAKYVAPDKRGITSKKIQGQKTTQFLFDATAPYCANLLATTLSSQITSPAIRWFLLIHRLKELNEEQEVLEWLYEDANRMYAAFEQNSLYPEIDNNIYPEMPIFGTGCLQIEDKDVSSLDFKGFIFKGISINEYYASEGINGKADTLFRQFELSARVAIERWGIENVGNTIKEANTNKPDAKFDFLHAVFPRIGGLENAVNNKQMKWASFFISLCDKQIISEGGYDSFPFVVPRWGKYSGEVYGRGIAHKALPDIITLNLAKQLGLQTLALSIKPPMQELEDSVVGNVALTPGARIIVRALNALTPIPLGINHDVKSIEVKDLRESIKQMFLTHHIESIMAVDAPRRTATEMRMKYGIMQWLLGPALSNIQNELLSPLIDRCFDIMLKKNAFPPVPQVLLDAMGTASGRDIDVVYESPLAKAQKVEELMAMESLYQMGATIAPVYPGVFDPIDHDKVMRKTGEIVGVPMDIYRKKEEIGIIREERDKAQMEAKQSQDALNVAEGLKKLTPLLQRGGNGQAISNQRSL